MTRAKSKRPVKKSRMAGVMKALGRQVNQEEAEQVLFEDVQQKIRDRSYYYFVERGYEHGHHEEDWARAETEILAEMGKN
jgi:hypothetical protein